ncbi:MAG: type II toxin-antitoxin system RatA family toxin [Cypionkella sp.]
MTRHHEEKFLPYTAAQMYDLVADVARYPEFLPWTAAARIRSRSPIDGGEVMEADLVISFKLFRERFGSRVTLLPGEGRIVTEYLDGPFKHLKSVWTFAEAPASEGRAGCKVVFDVEFEFRNAILSAVIGLVFNEAMTRVVRAFETRAQTLYGSKPVR